LNVSAREIELNQKAKLTYKMAYLAKYSSHRARDYTVRLLMT